MSGMFWQDGSDRTGGDDPSMYEGQTYLETEKVEKGGIPHG
jgi:hypothetical protein